MFMPTVPTPTVPMVADALLAWPVRSWHAGGQRLSRRRMISANPSVTRVSKVVSCWPCSASVPRIAASSSVWESTVSLMSTTVSEIARRSSSALSTQGRRHRDVVVLEVHDKRGSAAQRHAVPAQGVDFHLAHLAALDLAYPKLTDAHVLGELNL